MTGRETSRGGEQASGSAAGRLGWWRSVRGSPSPRVIRRMSSEPARNCGKRGSILSRTLPIRAGENWRCSAISMGTSSKSRDPSGCSGLTLTHEGARGPSLSKEVKAPFRASVTGLRREETPRAEGLHDRFDGQRFDTMTREPVHRLRREEGVDDRLLGGGDGRVEQRIDLVVGEHLHLRAL